MKPCITVTIAALMALAMTAPALPAEPGEVWMADFLLLRIRCPVAGYTVDQRVAAVEARAHELLFLDGINLNSIRVVPKGRDAVIYAGEALLITVTPCDAKANSTTPVKLANAWAQRLREIYPDVVPKKPLLEPTP